VKFKKRKDAKLARWTRNEDIGEEPVMSKGRFKKYGRVSRWDHKEEIDGINEGRVHIFEKIDGSNASVWLSEDKQGKWVNIGKKTGFLGRGHMDIERWWMINEDFRGLPKYVLNNKAFYIFFRDFPHYRLYGEWLVKHTIRYPEIFLNRLWIFDIMDDDTGLFLPYDTFVPILEKYRIDYIPRIETVDNPDMGKLLDRVRVKAEIPESEFGAETIEGLVYKNYDFRNFKGELKFMKAVTKEFREKHTLVMGGSMKDVPMETYLTAKYLTHARMEKIFYKMVDDRNGGLPKMDDIPEFLEKCLYDLFDEDAWNMFMKDKRVRKKSFQPFQFRKTVSVRAREWFIDKLQKDTEIWLKNRAHNR
jgi:hypothetical protein